MLSVAETLSAAADLIDGPGKWTQRDFAKDSGGGPIDPRDPAATCFCIYGAISHVDKNTPDDSPAGDFINEWFVGEGEYPDAWNDDLDRKQSEVVSKLRELSAIAKEQGK